METLYELLASDIVGRFDISQEECERIASKVNTAEEFLDIWEFEDWWQD